MAEAIAAARADGVTYVIFGDLFLRDVRVIEKTVSPERGSPRSSRSGTGRQTSSREKCSSQA